MSDCEIEFEGEWIVAIWPNGTWCDKESIHEYLTFMSDDYEIHRVLTYDEGYCPVKTERMEGC